MAAGPGPHAALLAAGDKAVQALLWGTAAERERAAAKLAEALREERGAGG